MTVSFKSSALSTAETITVPSGGEAPASGDLIVLLDRSSGFANPGNDIPTDFTAIVNLTDGAQNTQQLVYKQSDGTEGGTNITGLGGSGNDIRKILAIFTSDTSISSVAVQDIGSALQNSDPADQTANASAGAAPLVVIAGYGASGAVDPRSFSPAEDAELGPPSGATNLYMKYKIYNSSPADVTIGMDDEGSQNGLFSCYIEITEGAGGGGIAVPVAYHHLRMMKSR